MPEEQACKPALIPFPDGRSGDSEMDRSGRRLPSSQQPTENVGQPGASSFAPEDDRLALHNPQPAASYPLHLAIGETPAVSTAPAPDPYGWKERVHPQPDLAIGSLSLLPPQAPYTSRRLAEGSLVQPGVGRMIEPTVHGTLSSRSMCAPSGEGPIGLQLPTNPDIARPNRSFFEGAQNFRMGNFQYFDTNHVTVIHPPRFDSVDGWELLIKNSAPNALHNSYARYDAPKCDEDTRVEVTSELMDWIEDCGGPQRLLCMTGAAGSGKSTLQQTIAERCVESGIFGSAFFFSSADPTRNTPFAVVPTIAFQVGSHSPALKQYMSAVVAQDPLIFKRSLRTQMDSLLVRPLKHLQEQAELDLATLPYAILIDGLDECRGEDRQAELLTAIRECLLSDDFPFRIFIASRPEWAIRTALEPGGHLHTRAYHIQLSDEYDASGDMRRYLRRRFQDLCLRTGNPHWFTESDIGTLVRAASGQFIYVATVYRYISERRASPAERLRIVLAWTPREAQTARPFEALDKLFTDILLTAKNAYEAVDSHSGRDFLLLLNIHHLHCFTMMSVLGRMTDTHITERLRLESGSTEILISDLHSLMTMEKDPYYYLRMYHKSFSDFLNTESRSKDLYVPPSRVFAHMAKCCLHDIIHLPDLKLDYLRHAVNGIPRFWPVASTIDDAIIDFTQKGGWQKVDSLPGFWRSNFWLLSKNLGTLTDGIKNRNPEVVGVIRTFFDKWESEYAEFLHPTDHRREARMRVETDSDSDCTDDTDDDWHTNSNDWGSTSDWETDFSDFDSDQP